MHTHFIGGLFRVTLVVAFGFSPQNFGRWWDLWMILCHCMNVGSVVAIPWAGGETQPLSHAKELFQLCTQQAAGTQKLQAWVPSLSSEPPGETFTSIMFSRCADPDESDAGCWGADFSFGQTDSLTHRLNVLLQDYTMGSPCPKSSCRTLTMPAQLKYVVF